MYKTAGPGTTSSPSATGTNTSNVCVSGIGAAYRTAAAA